MKDELVTYTWAKGKRRACLVAQTRGDNRFAIGFAICHKGDVFTREMGRKIARGRIDTWCRDGNVAHVEYPYTIDCDINKFIIRCYKFFKNREPAYLLIPALAPKVQKINADVNG
jgi:hypothetical protein